MEDVIIYIKGKDLSKIKKQEEIIVRYCRKWGYKVLDTYINDENNFELISKKTISKIKRRKAAKIIIFNLGEIGNCSIDIAWNLFFLKIDNIKVETVFSRKTNRILKKDILNKIDYIKRNKENSNSIYNNLRERKFTRYNTYFFRKRGIIKNGKIKSHNIY